MTENTIPETDKMTMLRSLSDFSVMQSGSFPIEMSIRAKELGWHGFALTDQDTMAGIENLVGKKMAKGVANPICGVDLFLCLSHQPFLGDTRKVRLGDDARPEDFRLNYLPVGEMRGGRIALLAKSRAGYRSLCRLLERACGRQKVQEKDGSIKWVLDERYVLPSDLVELAEDVILLTGKPDGGFLWFLHDCLEAGDQQMEADAAIWKEETDDLFSTLLSAGRGVVIGFEKCRHLERGAIVRNEAFDRWLDAEAAHHDCKRVATWDVRYAAEKNKTTFLLQKAQMEGFEVSLDENGFVRERGDTCSPDYFIPSPEAFRQAFADDQDAVSHAIELGALCDFYPTSRDPIMPIATDDDLEPEFLNYAPEDTPEERAAKRDMAAKKTLEKRSRLGLEARLAIREKTYGTMTEKERKVYEDRLDVELDVIISRGYADYFLIVAEFIDWSRNNGVPVGPGRGSGAGSLVAWCLKITQPDPLEFGLLFERFLNPERKSMPDFDVDFGGEERDRTLSHMVEKYGENRVCGIISNSVLKPKSCIQDVARISHYFDLPSIKVADLSDFSSAFNDPKKAELSLPEMIEMAHRKLVCGDEPEIEDRVKKECFETFSTAWQMAGNGYGRLPSGNENAGFLVDSPVQAIIRGAGHLWSHLRGYGQHAAGVILLPDAVSNHLPIVRMNNSDRDCMGLSAFDMKGAERMGGVKFDFLGLNNLLIIEETLRVLREIDPDNTPDFDSLIDLDRRPDGSRYDRIYEALSDFKTQGVFQFDGGGMGDALRDVKPHRFSDAVAMVSLYRPGPMENIPLYARRNRERYHYETKLAEAKRTGEPEPEKPVYHLSDDPIIQEVLSRNLEETLGIFVYQEQIMLVAMELADYSLGEADLLRRAMGKKDKEEMARQGRRFMEGALKKGMKENAIQAVFDQMSKFADYGFNKSHAVAYAMISWRTTYLKVYHPEAFTVAILNCIESREKANPIISEMREMGVRILPADVNHSQLDASLEIDPESGSYLVRPGLKRLGGMKAAAEAILEERAKKGPYRSLRDFAIRMRSVGKCGITAIRSLVWAGALDDLSFSSEEEKAGFGEGRALLDWDGNPLKNRRLREVLAIHVKKLKSPKKEDTDQIDLFAEKKSDYWAWPKRIEEIEGFSQDRDVKNGGKRLFGSLSSFPDYTMEERKLLAYKTLHFFEGRSQEEELAYLAEHYNLPVRIPGVYIEFLRSVQIGQETHLPDNKDALDMLSGVAVAGRVVFVNVAGPSSLRVEITDDRDRNRYITIRNVTNQASLKAVLENAKKDDIFMVFPDCDVMETGDGNRRWVSIKCLSPNQICRFDDYAERFMKYRESSEEYKKNFLNKEEVSEYSILEAGSTQEMNDAVIFLDKTEKHVVGNPFSQEKREGKIVVILRFVGRDDVSYWVDQNKYDDPDWRSILSGCYRVDDEEDANLREKDCQKDASGVSFLYRKVVEKRKELEEKISAQSFGN